MGMYFFYYILTFYVPMESSLWFNTIHLGWYIEDIVGHRL